MAEQAPVRIYEKDRAAFERLRSLPMDQLLKQPVESLPFAVRVMRYCEKHNITLIGQMAKLKKANLLKARNLGRKTVAHMEAYLGALGLGLDGKLAADIPAPFPSAYAQGAKAMKLHILAQLTVMNVAHEVVAAVGKMALPTIEED